jgi:hypothetical protein
MRTPNANDLDAVLVELVDVLVVAEDVSVELVVVGVDDGVVVVAGVVDVPPSPDCPAAAGPAASAKNRMEAAVNRRQPVTAFEYDKPTLSLSCAYGVSCRARAERVCATPH